MVKNMLDTEAIKVNDIFTSRYNDVKIVLSRSMAAATPWRALRTHRLRGLLPRLSGKGKGFMS